MLHILDPVKLLHAQCVNTLVDADGGRGASAGGNCISRRILLQLNILVVHLLDVLLDLVVCRRRAAACLRLTWATSDNI